MEKAKFKTLIDLVFPKTENKVLALLRDILLVFSFAILTGICAKLKIEIGPVPITFQTFAVLLSGALLGAKRGALSQLAYLLMGLAGISWFSRGGGIQYIFSPTFGYIVGFVLCAFLVGFLCERGFDRKILSCILAMILGEIVLYIPGLLWLAKFVGFERVLKVGLYPFIVGDTLKMLLAAFILPFGWKLIPKHERS